jgi:3-dehydroquinate dehydratase / shikimate dehydrogenase
MKPARPLPRIAITATGSTVGELMECAQHALLESPFVELRLDWVARPVEATAAISKLLAGARRRRSRVVLQATCRRRPNGGKFRGSVAQQLTLLHQAVRAGCSVIDLEIESAEVAGARAVSELREIATLILSFHDFKRTPRLQPVARRLRRSEADFYKVVPTATRQSDNCAVLDFLSSVSETDGEAGRWVAFSMDEAGIASRVLALSHGSAFIYAAPTARRMAENLLAAPGQLDWSTLHEPYRVERLTAKTAIYGLLGDPVRHSVGVAVHNAAFRARGIDAVYLPLLATDLADFHRAAAKYPLAGFSVTIPHKRGVLRYIDQKDGSVSAAGAANTVRVRRGHWEAINTDVGGIEMPLRKSFRLGSLKGLPKNFRSVIVGNGGSARAAVIALQRLGCRQLFIAGRNHSHTRKLAAEFSAAAISLDALRSQKFDLLIHATPIGMWPHTKERLLRPDQLNAGTIFDLVYNPPDTRLLQMARRRGCRTISGLEMFIAQAAKQFEFWTGARAPEALMRRVAEEALEQRRGSGR